jgi:FdrA protein
MEKEKLIKSTEKLFNSELKVINVGLVHFAETLRIQGVKVEQVDWKPVAGGDKELGRLLDSMGFDD